jgi:peptidyl-prolyl cis-trans isomerase SurA
MKMAVLRVVPVALTLAVLFTGGVRAEVIEQILVKVNGEIFTKSDLEQRQIAAIRQRNRTVSQADLQNDAELKKMIAEVTPQIIVDAVDELLLIQRGRELGYRLSDEQFAQILQNIRKENKLENEEQFQAALKQEGLSIADLRRNIERQMLINRVQQQDVMEKISVSEEEARTYYELHKSELTTPAAITLREILVAVPEKAPEGTPGAGQAGVNVGLDEEAKAKIGRLRERVQNGEDFAHLAASVSDAASKANGGLIGPVNSDQLSPDLQQTLATMKPGDVTEPIRSTRGYQILKLESRSEAVIPSLEQARSQVADRVFREKSRPELAKYLKKLREQAVIEWKNEEIKKLYEQRLATPQS